MKTTLVKIPTEQIDDWESFHSVFARTFGFPAFYGRNMNAWIDCMTCLDSPESGLSTITVAQGDLVTLRIDDAPDFHMRCPIQYHSLIECAAFVNYRRLEVGRDPILTLMLAGFFAKPAS